MLRLKKGDTVEVIAGAEKGQRGKVLLVDTVADRVTVQGVNLRYKHIRRSQKHPQGGRIQLESPVHISNVMLVDNATDERTRFRAGEGKKGAKTRVSAKTGKPV